MTIFKKIYSLIKMDNRTKVLLPVICFLSLYTYFMYRFFKEKIVLGNLVDELDAQLDRDFNSVWIMPVSRAIKTMAQYTPWENVCRHQAYQAKILYRFFKIPYKIVVGFKKEEGEIKGHSWTVAGKKMVTGFCNANEYTIQRIYSCTYG